MNKKIWIAFGAIFLIFVITGVALVGSIWSKYSDWTTKESSIQASYLDRKNFYDNFKKSVIEKSQVAALNRDDVVAVVTAEMQGRYGKEGSHSMFQVLNEKGIVLDQSIRKDLSRYIESQRADWTAKQKAVIDQCMVYTNDLKLPPNNIIAPLFGFPKPMLINGESITVEKACAPITSDDTEKVFASGKDDPINLK